MKHNQFYLILMLLAAVSCNNVDANNPLEQKKVRDTLSVSTKIDSLTKSDIKIKQRIPNWVLRSHSFNGLLIDNQYKIEDRLNPVFLEADFNGDGFIDVAVPIYEIETTKKGYAIVHGETLEIFILGAGQLFKNALSDNQDYIDFWRINTTKINEPGVEEETGTGENGTLILTNPSIEIEADEVGGGQIYWDGKEYAYFHQTC